MHRDAVLAPGTLLVPACVAGASSAAVVKRRQDGLHPVWFIQCVQRLEQGEGVCEETPRSRGIAQSPVEESLGHQHLRHFVAGSKSFQDL